MKEKGVSKSVKGLFETPFCHIFIQEAKKGNINRDFVCLCRIINVEKIH